LISNKYPKISAALEEFFLTHENLKSGFRIGGSVLLNNLGSPVEPRDLDLVCFLQQEVIKPLLMGRNFESIVPKLPYLTKYLFRFEVANVRIDLMGSFALSHPVTGARIEISKKTLTEAIGNGRSRGFSEGISGVSFSDPYSWRDAYEAMGRVESASFLKRFLEKKS
jgi:hypothetical protein